MSRAQRVQWETRDGRVLFVAEMADGHLANSYFLDDRRILQAMGRHLFETAPPPGATTTRRGSIQEQFLPARACREILEEEVACRGLDVEFARAVDRDGRRLWDMMYASDPSALKFKYKFDELGRLLDGTHESVEVFRDAAFEAGSLEIGEALSTGHDPHRLLPRLSPYATSRTTSGGYFGWFLAGEGWCAGVRVRAAALRGGAAPVGPAERMFLQRYPNS